MNNKLTAFVLLWGIIGLLGCSDATVIKRGNSSDWSIPQDEVFDGGPGKDGIPALTTPRMINSTEANYLKEFDLVVGYKRGDDIRAYPHPILDWHEIVNDEVDNHPIAIIYCPLTGTATGWERTLNGTVTTFGVSGLLYNTNVIPYDRLTDSNWSQIRQNCVNGELREQQVEPFQVIETTWFTWKRMFPETKVMSVQTGYNRIYGFYPYGDYKINDEKFLFPFKPKDNRLPAKERVLGVIVDGKAKVYQFKSFVGELVVRQDLFNGMEIVVFGSGENNFLSALSRRTDDNTLLTFSAASAEIGISGIALTDNEGNRWNVFGEAVSGPRTGQKLKAINSFIGYWFAWGAFYPCPEIFDNPNSKICL